MGPIPLEIDLVRNYIQKFVFFLQPQVNNLTLNSSRFLPRLWGSRPKVCPEPSPSQLKLGTQGTCRNGGYRRHLRPAHSRKFGSFPRLRSTSAKLAAFFGFWGHTFQSSVRPLSGVCSRSYGVRRDHQPYISLQEVRQ